MLVQLRAAGTGVVVDARAGLAPAIVHFGRDLGDVDLATLADALVPAVPPSAVDVPQRLSLLAGPDQGWTGRPAVSGAALLAWRTVSVAQPSPRTLTTVAVSGALRVTTTLELTPPGILRIRHRLVNDGDDVFRLSTLDVLLPVPERASESLDFSGLWSYERRPQRGALRDGVWSRESTTRT
jgi:alpha-galactosidase